MRFSFFLKIAVVTVLVILFDRLFPSGFSGARIGGMAIAWLIGLLLVRPEVRRNRNARVAAAAAALLAALLFDNPGPLAWIMFWCALSMAALLPRTARFDDAWHWGARLTIHAFAGVAMPVSDAVRFGRRRRHGRFNLRAVAATLGLPLAGSVLFVALFAAANPLIEQVVDAIRLPSFWQVMFWILVAFCIWPSLRPHAAIMRITARLPDPEPVLPGTSLSSVLIALALFNALFALQNGLDIAFLWGGGRLPAGMSQADYVHRGAYPLIGTALIAGVMSLAMLRPGSASEHHPWARRLVTCWVVQNLILVASSARRTIDYIETSMLTSLRIAALAWMALVALGLILICWRILRGRSARWLINWNALAATIVLAICSVVDLGSIAASWNVRQKDPSKIDLCYLNEVGDGALLPLIALENRPLDAVMRDRVRYMRSQRLVDLEARQGRWTDWTLRGARRLAAAHAMIGPHAAVPVTLEKGAWRDCDGSIRSASVEDGRP